MHIIIILLVIIILLLGGWWIFAVGIGLLLAAIGAVIAAVVWLIRTLWPVIAIGFAGFLVLGTIGWLLEAKSGRKTVRNAKPPEPEQRELPPISRTWAARKKDKDGAKPSVQD